MNFDSMKSTAIARATKLKAESGSIKKNTVLVSKYSVNGQMKYSVRHNEISNRINDLDFVELLFLVYELHSRPYFVTSSGLSLTNGHTEIIWPEKKSMVNLLSRFKTLTVTAISEERKAAAMKVCKDWSDTFSKGSRA
jgi:hypothetical protein